MSSSIKNMLQVSLIVLSHCTCVVLKLFISQTLSLLCEYLQAICYWRVSLLDLTLSLCPSTCCFILYYDFHVYVWIWVFTFMYRWTWVVMHMTEHAHEGPKLICAFVSPSLDHWLRQNICWGEILPVLNSLAG